MYLAFICSVCLLAATDELDPNNMHKGETGTLPRSTERFHYVVVNVLDDDVLVVALQFNERERVYNGAGRFYFKDAATVEKYRKIKTFQPKIELPDTYKVIGTKAAGRASIPRLQRVSP